MNNPRSPNMTGEPALRAYHGSDAIKAEYVKRVIGHELADEIVKGVYWENGHGCGVGCTIHGHAHMRYEVELGIPVMLARLEDRLFEGMSPADAKTFPRRFLEVIPVGADLSLVGWKFLSWLVETTLERHAGDATRDACREAVAVLRDKAEGKEVAAERADAAFASARGFVGGTCAAYAARAAAYTTDAFVDLVARVAVTRAAADAADAVEPAAYAEPSYATRAAALLAVFKEHAAARAAAFKEQAEKLLALMAEAPVPAATVEIEGEAT
jgi:hypothetical protein